MEFHTIDTIAQDKIQKGYWMPIFKSRYNNSYFDTIKKENYEYDLRNRIFKYGGDIVITKNGYPFNLGCNHEQLVIWIKNSEKDPGIEKIKNIVEKIYPGYDFQIYINLYNYRSIKSILHYHAILKIPNENYYLEKLIVFHRHGNREPILRIPIFDKLLGEKKCAPYKNCCEDSEAVLLPIGHKNSYKFGKDLKVIYNLDDKFLQKSIFLTSPVFRCQETIKNIIESFGINSDMVIDDLLKLTIPGEINMESEKNILFRKEYENILNKLDNIFNLNECFRKNPRRLMDLYEYHSSIQCYRDMGINIREFIDEELEKNLNIASCEVYNITSYYNQKSLDNLLKNILNKTLTFENNLVMCSSHDTLIFLLVKYFAEKNGISYNFELPHYLSNVRIEKWSNGIVRIFYNNYYIGNLIS